MNHLLPALLAGFGGFLGSAARYLAGVGLQQVTMSWRFPLPTFAINLTGSLAIGILAALAGRGMLESPGLRVFLFTGILGGFTTFSTFSQEGVSLFRRGEPAVAAAYVALSVGGGLLAAWAGWRLAGGE